MAAVCSPKRGGLRAWVLAATAHAHRRGDAAIGAVLDQHAAMRRMVLREGLRDRVDGTGGHADAHQVAAQGLDREVRERLLPARHAARPGARRRLALVAKRASAARSGRAICAQSLRNWSSLATPEEDLAVAGRELVVGADVRMRAAEQARRAARLEPVGRMRNEQRQPGVEQRGLDMLAGAGAFARDRAPSGCRCARCRR